MAFIVNFDCTVAPGRAYRHIGNDVHSRLCV